MNPKIPALTIGFLLGGRRRCDLVSSNLATDNPLSTVERGLGASSREIPPQKISAPFEHPSRNPRESTTSRRDNEENIEEVEPLDVGASEDVREVRGVHEGTERRRRIDIPTRFSAGPRRRHPSAKTAGQSLSSRIRQFVFPPPRSALTSTQGHTVRFLPILSGIAIPFSILLSIPGLTEHWYIVTENDKTVLTHPNSALLNVGMAISLACAVCANVAIIVRFMEKQVLRMTLLAIAALSVHGRCRNHCRIG
jgi:hypothetical protein